MLNVNVVTRRGAGRQTACTVIPGRAEGPDPESRESGFGATHRPGM